MKKKVSSIIAGLCLLICLSLLMAGCEKYVEPIRINFYVDCEVQMPDGQQQMAKAFQPGETIKFDPKTDMNYDIPFCYFDGWYLDRECTQKFIQSEWEPKNCTLYGIYRRKTYTVTFKADSETFDTQKVKYGDKATEPTEEPTKEGHHHNGWRAAEYVNAEGNVVEVNNFDFNDAIYADTVIESVWEKNRYKVKIGLDYRDNIFDYNYFDYKDNIKEFLKELEKNEFEGIYKAFIPDGYFYDENFTRPIDLDTYEVTGDDTIYMRTRVDFEYVFGLEKEPDGTYGITKLKSFYMEEYGSSYHLTDSDGITRIPGEIINRQGEKYIISTIKTGALKQVSNDKGIVVLDKNIKRLESVSLGQQYGWYMYSARFFFESKESEMEIAEDYIGADSEKNVVAYFGVDYKFNDDFFYQDTGNDIIILHSRQEGGDLIIPEKIDGKPVTKINSAAISYYSNVYLSDKISSIQSHAIRRVDNLYCAFSEGFGTDVLPSEWRDSYGTVHYNSPYPPQL